MRKKFLIALLSIFLLPCFLLLHACYEKPEPRSNRFETSVIIRHFIKKNDRVSFYFIFLLNLA